MPTVVEQIPSDLQPAARAALEWINETRGARFKLTGLVDPELAQASGPDEPMDLGLVLCEGDVCLREQVRVQPKGDGFEVSAIEAEPAPIPPHLDPPQGVRKGWLDEQLGRHAFVVLVFYRGFW